MRQGFVVYNTIPATIEFMDASQISQAKGAEVFVFSYDRCDLASTFVFSSANWGSYSADGTITVADTVSPGIDETLTSTGGSILFSVPLFQLDDNDEATQDFTSAHVSWEGSGFTVEYTVDGETWTAIDKDGAVALTETADLDYRVTFAGGVVDDPSELISLTVYVFKSDVVHPLTGQRTASFTGDAISDGEIILRGGQLDISPDPADPANPIRTIEFIAAMDGTTGEIALGPCDVRLTDGLIVLQDNCTVYVNGAPYTWVGYDPTQQNHYVIVLNADTNALVTLGLIDMTMDHLALYNTEFTADDVAALYAAQTPTPIRIDDTGAITVSEGWTISNADGTTSQGPTVDIYAFPWSIVSGGTS